MAAFDRLAPGARSTTSSTPWAGALRPLQDAGHRAGAAPASDAAAAGPDGRRQDRGGASSRCCRAMAERALARPVRALRLPARALLNNLEPRLERYAGWLGRRAASGTATSAPPQRRRILRRPARHPADHARVAGGDAGLAPRRPRRGCFAGVRAVVVDEVHAFAGDDRGWHLLAVLERLDRLAGRDAPADRPVGHRRQPRRAAGLAARRGADRPAGAVVRPRRPAPTPPPPRCTLDYVGHLDNAATVIAAPAPRREAAGLLRQPRARSRSSPPRCASAGVDDVRLAQLARPSTSAGGPSRRSPRRATASSSPPAPWSWASTSATSTASSRSTPRAPSRRSCSASAAPAGGRAPRATACSSPPDDERAAAGRRAAHAVGAGYVEPVAAAAGAAPHPRPAAAGAVPAGSTGSATGTWPRLVDGLPVGRPTAPSAIVDHLVADGLPRTRTTACCSSARRPSALRPAALHGTDRRSSPPPPSSPSCTGAPRSARVDPGPAHRKVDGPRVLLLAGRTWRSPTSTGSAADASSHRPADPDASAGKAGRSCWDSSSPARCGRSYSAPPRRCGSRSAPSPSSRVCERSWRRLADPGATVVMREPPAICAGGRGPVRVQTPSAGRPSGCRGSLATSGQPRSPTAARRHHVRAAHRDDGSVTAAAPHPRRYGRGATGPQILRSSPPPIAIPRSALA